MQITNGMPAANAASVVSVIEELIECRQGTAVVSSCAIVYINFPP